MKIFFRHGTFSWLKYCYGRSTTTEISSEDSSECVVPTTEDCPETTSLSMFAQNNSLRKTRSASQVCYFLLKNNNAIVISLDPNAL